LTEPQAAIETYEAADGYSLHYRHWQPPEIPRARVVVLHGIQSHSGWYLHSSARLCQAGFEVCYLDRRGSGLNTKDRGHVDSFHVLLDDLVLFLSRVRIQEPRRPVVLIGVSWGGKLATALAKEHPQLIDALALLCPGLFPRIDPPWYQKIRIGLARVYWRYRHFTIPLTDPELFTATPRWLQFLRTDALSLHRATAAMLVASARLDWFVRNAPEKITLPALLMQAGKDRIIDNARTKAFFDRFASANRRHILYSEAHHTLEFEPDPESFIQDLIGWLHEVSVRGDTTKPKFADEETKLRRIQAGEASATDM
jgi:alpha-beta hydrolase superfamily lysophospholipase